MTTNYPGPYQVRLFYQANGHAHEARYNCDLDVDLGPGQTFADYEVLLRGGLKGTLQGRVDAWVDLIKVLFNSANSSFTYAELWKYVPGTNQAQFYSAYQIGVAGTSASGAAAYSQAILSFISQEGGALFIQFMESILTQNVTDNYPFAVAAVNDIADFVASDDNWIMAKDTSYPIAPRNYNCGQNEALWKKFNRL
jgi:hypothetical protein